MIRFFVFFILDALVYLKLAFFYEDFATKDWIDAAEHSQRYVIFRLIVTFVSCYIS